jgi:hypothetical protein
VAVSASGDTRLFVATKTTVTCLEHRDDAWAVAWQSQAAFGQIAAVCSAEGSVLVADRAAGTVVTLDSAGGAAGAPVGAQVPGGMEPVGVAYSAGWAFVSDAKGHRVLRFKAR